jgi:2-keto-myo-inositol isomerase
MRQRLCLNMASIKRAALVRQIGLAAAAGFDGVGLWMDDIDAAVRQGFSIEEISAQARASSLSVEEICFIGGWQDCDQAAFPSVLAEADRICGVARSLGCPLLVAVPSMRRGTLAGAPLRFRELCAVAATYGVRIALEFVGTAEEIRNVPAAWRMVEASGNANGGLLLDTFHYFLGGSTPKDLAAIPAEKVFLVHVSDAMAVSREKLSTFHDYRTFPGDGTIDYTPVLDWMKRTRYGGAVSLEIWNQELLKGDPESTARRGIGSLRKLTDGEATPPVGA